MKIQINTDKTISAEQRTIDFFNAQISADLDRFESQVTRIEVHLKDENGKKDGVDDISCLLEARLEGRQPIVVTHKGNSVEEAIGGATDKAKAALTTLVGKMRKH